MMKIIYLFILAVLHAMWETEIEGSAGWAKNLPTWRLKTPFKKILSGKEITGYHTLMFLIFLLGFHSPILFMEWSWAKELITIGTFLIYLIVEDLLWFILNPYYSFKRFWEQKVRWHKKWFMKLPLEYWYFILTGITLILIGKNM